MSEQANDYAIIIGLNHYPTFGAQGRPLAGAIEDATRFKSWLTDPNVGGGLPEANCQLLCSTPDRPWPKREAVDEALHFVWRSAKSKGGGRRLYLYFSGHGQARRRDDVAMCLPHWSAEFRHAALSSDAYREMLLRCGPFAELIVLLDCCRIRSIDAAGGASELGCATAVADSGAKRSLIAFASEFQNAAMEAESAGGVGATGEGPIVRGHFTEALLQALYGGAANTAGGVLANELKRYLENNVPRIAAAHGHTQHAHVIIEFPEDAQPVLGAASPQANTCIKFSSTRSGVIALEGERLKVIREGDAADGPWQLGLPVGLYRLVERDTGSESYVRIAGTDGMTHVTF